MWLHFADFKRLKEKRRQETEGCCLFCFHGSAHSLKVMFAFVFSLKGNTPRIQALKAQDKELAKYLESK